MTEFKVTINNPKTGKSYKRDVSGSEADVLLSKDVGENVSGDTLGFAGYEFQITGGSDSAGFPMRRGVRGLAREQIYTYKGVGFSGRDRWKKTQKGLRVKTTVRGQKIGAETTQVNLKIVKEGSQDAFAEKKEAETKEEPKAEEKKEEPKTEMKEEKKETKATETKTPKEEPKAVEEPNKEEKNESKEKPQENEVKGAPKEKQ